MVRVLTLACLSLAGSLALAQTPAPGHRPTPSSPASPPPAAASTTQEQLRPFEPRNVRLAWVNRHWQLLHNGELLKDFGTREQDARQALRIINELRLNQYGTVGSPLVMEYWLSDGNAPRPQARTALRALPLDGANLRVEMAQGKWWLRDGKRALFAFGQQADADAALAVMKKYHFDQIALVGNVTPTMHVFTSRQGGDGFIANKAGSSRQLAPKRFSRQAKNADGSPRGPVTTSKSVQPLAGVITPALPALSGHTTTPPLVYNGANRSGLMSAQTPRWRTQQGNTMATANAFQPDRVPFDWRRAQIRQEGADWKLVCGGLTLANFGPNAHEARLALSAVRHYRFTEQWRAAGDGHSINYCTASGAAPKGLLLGLPAQVLQPEKLEVRQEAGNYALCDGKQVVLQMGKRPDDARRLLEVIQKNKYDRLCQIGEPSKEGLALLVKSR